jgi:anaerobic ribonucleoside-triphosphate reductase activating protein
MKIHLQVPQTEAEGPGIRYALWLQGCNLRCPECCNPEALPLEGGTEFQVDELLENIVGTPNIEGITLLGGEPLQQVGEVIELSKKVQAAGLNVMVFSGYTVSEILRRPTMVPVLKHIDILVDGRYDRKKPDTARRWVGSTNQVMHFLTDAYVVEDERFWTTHESRTVELRLRPRELVVNGWPTGAF